MRETAISLAYCAKLGLFFTTCGDEQTRSTDRMTGREEAAPIHRKSDCSALVYLRTQEKSSCHSA